MKFLTPNLTLILLFMVAFSTAQEIRTSRISEMDAEKSILKNTENSENHKTLLTAMRAADLEEVLGYDGPFTVFAPHDDAFDNLPEDMVEELLKPENKKQLHALMTYHIVAGNLSASNILRAMCRGKGKATFTTVQGGKITATMRGIDIVLTDSRGNSATIVAADASQCNGVIHEIDSVILPSEI